jgi:hypothetical protein
MTTKNKPAHFVLHNGRQIPCCVSGSHFAGDPRRVENM